MRVMDPDILFQSLEELGFTKPDLEHYNRFITKAAWYHRNVTDQPVVVYPQPCILP